MTVIVCYSRCLICLRRTPHETCHRHSLAMGGGRNWPKGDGDRFERNMRAMQRRWFDREPEVCDDPACPADDPNAPIGEPPR